MNTVLKRHHDTLRALSVTSTADEIRVGITAPRDVLVRRVALVPRRGLGTELWATDVPAAGEVSVTVPVGDLAAAVDRVFDDIATRPASAPDRPFATVLDLVVTLESPSDHGDLRQGVHEYARIDVDRPSFEAATPRPGPGGVLTAYMRRGGNLSVLYARTEPPARGKASMTWVRRHRTSWDLVGAVDSQSYAVTGGELVLVSRRTGERVALPTTVTPREPVGEATGARRTTFEAHLDQAELLGRFDRPEYLDAWFCAEVAGHATTVDIPVRKVAPSLRLAMPTSIFGDGTSAGEMRAYRTFKAHALAFEFRPVAPDAVDLARRPMRSALRLRHQTRHRPVWVVGERPETAQDTGIALYEHLRDHHPEIDARYVLTPGSPDRRRLEGDPGLVEFGSREHLEATLAARRILSSHHSDYLLAARGPAFQRATTARRVFLQHGVMGTKNMVANYGYDAPGFSAESFIVSSDRERRMIEDDFGWPHRRVFVTGLSRHDKLFDEHPEPDRTLLVMPTWRDWLRGPEDVLASEFHRRWNDLLHAPEFVAYLERNGLTAKLYLHANLQPYLHLFDLSHVQVVHHGEVSIQDLMLSSAVLLTDYTSAAIDFSFLDRPVVYYQFDRTRFIGARPSHFDLDEELPGEIAMTSDEVLEELDAIAARGFRISPAARSRASRLIAHRDTGARERIVEAARETPRRRLVPPAGREAIGTAERVWARTLRRRDVTRVLDRVRTPMRKAVYRLARTLPRSGTIVLESNIGGDTGDSPGAIHDVLVERGHADRTAWVVLDGVEAPHGAAAIERLSLRYLWTVGRASVWVDNQNMPSWMRRPEATFYLQTWHGTPLKRMLHDLDTVVGRDSGYVGRVDRMIREWSLLLSPSPWATERFRSAFRYEGEVLESGYPRNDVLADERGAERAQRVRRSLGLARSKKVLLYAPTFRDDQTVGKRFTFAIPIDLHQLKEQVGDEYEIVVRLHPIVRGKVVLPDGVHNAGVGFQMEDLLAAADVLVTDYSSVMFDFSVLERPMLFFVPDLERYRDTLRGFYLDFEAEAPGPLLRTTSELVEVLTDPARLTADLERVAQFRRRFAPLDDGAAAERVVDELERRGVLPRRR